MVRRITTLLMIGGAFVVMTASACPPEFCEFVPEVCEGGVTSADSEAEYADSGEAEEEQEVANAGQESGGS